MAAAEQRPSLLHDFFGGVKPPERTFLHRPPVALVEDRPGLDAFLRAYGMQSFKAEGIPGRVICPTSYQVNLDPIPHNNGSHAKYYIDGQPTTGGDVVFVYTLDPDSHTSHHTHEVPLSEDYFLLHGSIRVGGQPMEEYLHVPSNSEHQVTTSPNQSRVLVMAVLRNGAAVPPDQWHTKIEDHRK